MAKAVLISAVPPIMLKTAANPGGLAMEAFDQIRAGVLADRSEFFKDLTAPFYGAKRPGAKVSEGLRDSFWLQGMQAGFKGVIDEADQRRHAEGLPGRPARPLLDPQGPGQRGSARLLQGMRDHALLEWQRDWKNREHSDALSPLGRPPLRPCAQVGG